MMFGLTAFDSKIRVCAIFSTPSRAAKVWWTKLANCLTEDPINFHMVIAGFTFIGAFIHIIAHCVQTLEQLQWFFREVKRDRGRFQSFPVLSSPCQSLPVVRAHEVHIYEIQAAPKMQQDPLQLWKLTDGERASGMTFWLQATVPAGYPWWLERASGYLDLWWKSTVWRANQCKGMTQTYTKGLGQRMAWKTNRINRSMIHDDSWWFMMIHDDSWWSGYWPLCYLSGSTSNFKSLLMTASSHEIVGWSWPIRSWWICKTAVLFYLDSSWPFWWPPSCLRTLGDPWNGAVDFGSSGSGIMSQPCQKRFRQAGKSWK